MAFALEQAIDEAALRLNVDPIQLRKRWDPNPDRQRLYDWAAGLESVAPAVQPRGAVRPLPPRRWHRRGLLALPLAIEDGRLVASTATQDIGTRTRSVIADTVAREFALEPHEVEVRIGDSKLPNGPGSSGSRVTASIVPPLLIAAEKLKAGVVEKTGRRPAPGSNAPWRDLVAASPDFQVEAERLEDNPRTAYGNNSLIKDAGIMGWILGFMVRRSSHLAIGAGAPSSVQVIEVEVDMALGRVRVLGVHSGVAVGKLAAPALARNQAAGAVVQGLGYALYEGREVDPATGDVLTTSLDDYRMPGIADIPPIDLHFDEGGFDHVHGQSVGIGEVATVPTSAAIANAIHNSIGVRPCEIPIRPDRLMSLLDRRSSA
jgi:xanthine dehydrogenase YagR molybdenum-binding subunit